MRKLVPCSVCQRHVRSTEAACPFCGGALSQGTAVDDFVPGLVSRAAALALTATLAATGCNRNDPPRPPAPSAPTARTDEYNPPPGPPIQAQNPTPQTQKPDPTVPSPQVAVPLPQRPNPYGSVATRYGAPPRPTRPNNNPIE